MKINIFGVWLFAFGLLMGSAGASAQTKSVAIFSYQQDEVTAEMTEGIREVLRTAGFREGRNLRLRLVDAQGSSERALQLALDTVRGKPDVVIVLSLPAAQAVMKYTTHIPVVFAGITDPVASEVVSGWGPSGSNVTGVTDALPLQKRVALIKQISPQARRVGVIYNPTDASSVAAVKEFQESLSGSGLIAIELTVLRPLEVGSAARSLIEKVDVFQTFLDPTVNQAYVALAQVANDARIPLLGWDTKDVKAGAVAALDLTAHDLGSAAGRLALRVLRGVKPGAIAPEIIAHPPVYVNMQAATKQSVTFSAALLKIVRPLVRVDAKPTVNPAAK
ncbi:MAG: ABC transporter substrate-binding protein [Burkholderiaceae bacterium]|jgi:putative tryptophan/tyrosine transport system substrate-binding protein|nr:ABC transporter substrate-binding protein [Burkholderiaceae bacterium]MDP4968745.1 ABC transporter substrate-binding protein [Burkholderiaceae bacterium]MDP5112009.1 ABC transporter substrate-binding protein [Burkholderiaceae bacterium]